MLQALGRDSYSDVLQDHHDLVRDIVGDGVVSTEGDSFFCVFRTPGEGVNAAIAVQRALNEHEWPKDITVRVRMGIHTGEGVLGGDNYVGLDVHKAARISSAAHGGQVIVSAATQAQVAADLPDGVGLLDLGEHRLKDLAQPEHLYQLAISGMRDEFPPPNSLQAAPSNLPEHLSSFVGRQVELQEVLDALGEARLLTLTGPGGAGKTRLAIEAGRGARSQHRGGVFFSTLADVDDPELVAAHVAAELSIPEQVGRPIDETLVEYLAPRQALLIIDNCEHLADTVAALTDQLLRSCTDLTVLTTSREALLIPGERLYEVGPMTIGGGAEALDSDAVRLFVARAAEVAPGFDPTTSMKVCADICRRLDGIPLAIELAAARVGMLTPAEILSRLDDRFSLLTSRSRTAAPRQRTLEAAIDWSYDLLDDDARRLLRALAIFRGGFTLEAVAQVCFADGTSEALALDHLTELNEKSLLTQETTFAGTRFGLLETIREYAAVRLHQQGEYEEVERRHRGYFTGLARHQANRLGGEDQLDALDALEADHDNFRAVMRRALADDDYEAAANMAGRLVWFWYLHAHFTEGERWAGRLLAELPRDPARPWLYLLLGSAQYDFRLGNYDRADERLRVVLEAADGRDLQRIRMWAHAYRATNDLYRVHLEQARADAQQAAETASETGDFVALGYASYLLAAIEAWESVADSDDEKEKAEELLERVTPLSAGARASGERNIIGHILQLDGMLAAMTGDHERASAAFDEAITALTELGTVGCAAHCLEAIADYVARRGHHDAAARLIAASDQLRKDVGITVAPVEERWRSRARKAIMSELTEEDVQAAEAEGSRLGLAEVAQLARQTVART